MAVGSPQELLTKLKELREPTAQADSPSNTAAPTSSDNQSGNSGNQPAIASRDPLSPAPLASRTSTEYPGAKEIGQLREQLSEMAGAADSSNQSPAAPSQSSSQPQDTFADVVARYRKSGDDLRLQALLDAIGDAGLPMGAPVPAGMLTKIESETPAGRRQVAGRNFAEEAAARQAQAFALAFGSGIGGMREGATDHNPNPGAANAGGMSPVPQSSASNALPPPPPPPPPKPELPRPSSESADRPPTTRPPVMSAPLPSSVASPIPVAKFADPLPTTPPDPPMTSERRHATLDLSSGIPEPPPAASPPGNRDDGASSPSALPPAQGGGAGEIDGGIGGGDGSGRQSRTVAELPKTTIADGKGGGRDASGSLVTVLGGNSTTIIQSGAGGGGSGGGDDGDGSGGSKTRAKRTRAHGRTTVNPQDPPGDDDQSDTSDGGIGSSNQPPPLPPRERADLPRNVRNPGVLHQMKMAYSRVAHEPLHRKIDRSLSSNLPSYRAVKNWFFGDDAGGDKEPEEGRDVVPPGTPPERPGFGFSRDPWAGRMQQSGGRDSPARANILSATSQQQGNDAAPGGMGGRSGPGDNTSTQVMRDLIRELRELKNEIQQMRRDNAPNSTIRKTNERIVRPSRNNRGDD